MTVHDRYEDTTIRIEHDQVYPMKTFLIFLITEMSDLGTIYKDPYWPGRP